MKRPFLTVLGTWLAAVSLTLVFHRWSVGLDPEFIFFLWSFVFTGAVVMILHGLGVLTNEEG